jgi:hypothetical protein
MCAAILSLPYTYYWRCAKLMTGTTAPFCRSFWGPLFLVLKLSPSREICSTNVRLVGLSPILMRVKSSEMLRSVDW